MELLARLILFRNNSNKRLKVGWDNDYLLKVLTCYHNSLNCPAYFGWEHKTVNYGQGEYARDDDDDGFHEVHVNTLEGVVMTKVFGQTEAKNRPFTEC